MLLKNIISQSHVIMMENSLQEGKKPSENEKTLYANYTYNTPFSIRTISSGSENKESSKLHVFDSPHPLHSTTEESDNLFISLKGFLIIGKIIGLLPFSGVFGGHSAKDLTYRRSSLTSIVTHIIFVGLLFNTTLAVIASIRASKRNALEIANSIRATLYYVWATYLFYTFLFRGNQFLEIFTSWSNTWVVFKKKDKTLRRDALLISGVTLTSAILENSVLSLEYINTLDSITGDSYGNHTDNMTVLEGYYWRANSHWAHLIPYNCVFAVLTFIQHKWILYAWNYMDICIAIFGRAMYFRFKALYELAEEKLVGSQESRLSSNNDMIGVCRDRSAWLQLVHDHLSLCRLLELLEAFFSPLVFMSYAVNMFYICLQLLDGLTSEVSKNSIVHTIYAPWSFIHLIIRAYMVSICCARINVYAHKIRNIFQECPVECYTTEVSRLDKRVIGGPDIGLTGLGCFVVTKPYILSILSVVFTLEIVLLQCVPSDISSTSASCPK